MQISDVGLVFVSDIQIFFYRGIRGVVVNAYLHNLHHVRGLAYVSSMTTQV